MSTCVLVWSRSISRVFTGLGKNTGTIRGDSGRPPRLVLLFFFQSRGPRDSSVSPSYFPPPPALSSVRTRPTLTRLCPIDRLDRPPTPTTALQGDRDPREEAAGGAPRGEGTRGHQGRGAGGEGGKRRPGRGGADQERQGGGRLAQRPAELRLKSHRRGSIPSQNERWTTGQTTEEAPERGERPIEKLKHGGMDRAVGLEWFLWSGLMYCPCRGLRFVGEGVPRRLAKHANTCILEPKGTLSLATVSSFSDDFWRGRGAHPLGRGERGDWGRGWGRGGARLAHGEQFG